MNFIEWLREFKNVDRPIGDLAKDVLSDSNFPKSNNYNELHDYLLYKARVEHAVLEVFKAVWKAYKTLI